MSHADTIPVRVVAVEQVTPHVKHFRLASVSGSPLPAFSGGSHIVVVMTAASRIYRNPYSLMSSPSQLDRYEIGVRRMEDSRGGSHFMHDEVRVGSVIDIAHPVNLFPLDKIARKHLLVAAGIGITPIMAQLADLHAGTVPYELHYAVRSPEHAAFREQLEQREPGRFTMYYRSAGQRIDFMELLSHQPLGTHLYVCGSGSLINNARGAARECGWPDSHVHWEQFSAPPAGEAFDVHLARSALDVHVVPDQSLLESIEAAGVEVPYLCRGGVCGFCRTSVLELDGEIIHNDHYLSDEEKASGKAIMPCVSRARCKKLVLDL
jgi:dimethylamine monooxygenase subunit B